MFPVGSLRLRRSWIIPPGIPKLNQNHPLAQGLLCAYVPGCGYLGDVSGRFGPLMVPRSAQAFSMSARGLGDLETANNSGLTAAAPAGLQVSTVSVFWYGYVFGNNLGANPLFFGTQYDASGNFPYVSWGLANGNFSGDTFYLFNSCGGSFNYIQASVVTGFHTLGGSVTAGQQRLYTDGVQAASAAVAGNPTYGATPTSAIGCYMGQPSSVTNSVTLLCLAWSRILSPAEFATLSVDPFGPFIYPGDNIMAELTAPGVSPSVATYLMAQILL